MSEPSKTSRQKQSRNGRDKGAVKADVGDFQPISIFKVSYKPRDLDRYVLAVSRATPIQRVEMERAGVPGAFIKDLAMRMEMPSSRFFKIIGLPKATAEKKVAMKQLVAGSSGHAALGVTRLIGVTQEILATSTSKGAKGFDAAKWLGNWIERPQPSLGGRRPAELLDTPTGLEVVNRLLGAIESGSYQ
ncbi:MAG: antitoxin Xre/MbcA/ParS toxin-binding domain-containing protein [Usitatibacter sp.]